LLDLTAQSTLIVYLYSYYRLLYCSSQVDQENERTAGCVVLLSVTWWFDVKAVFHASSLKKSLCVLLWW